MQGTVWTWQLADKSNPAFNQLFKKFDTMDKKVAGIEGNTLNSFDRMNKKSSKFGSNFKKNLAGIKQELPMVGNGLALLSNPLTLVAGAAIGAVGAIRKASQEQAIFNNEFLELKNLNLDKTDKEIDDLRDRVLRLSFDKALNPQKTSKAFFDVQSATGKYGKEVENLVGKVGVFSRTMKADFNTSVEGAAKAMGIFQFGNEQLDDYLASSFKTVQVGVTTFDQLSKVQVEYLGSAKAAGQGFNEANKLFSVFSKNAKSVDIAATLTKTAFQDLGKKSTQRGLEKIGVNLFDATGKMKGLDNIIKEVVPKLSEMNDSDFSKLKEDIGGSEGIRGLLDQLKNSGDDVLKTFDSFNNTEFDFDKALKNANGDLEVMNEIVDNKLTNSWIRFGQSTEPYLIKLKSLTADFLDHTSEAFNSLSYITDFEGTTKKHEGAGRKEAFNKLNNSFLSVFKSQSDIDNFKSSDQSELLSKFKDELKSNSSENIKNIIKDNQNWYPSKIKQDKFTGEAIGSKVLLKYLEKVEEGSKSIDDVFKLVGFSLNQNKPQTESTVNLLGSVANTSSSSSSERSGGLAGIYAAADKVKNVTVNIQNLVEKFTVHSENGEGLSSEEIMHKIEEVLIRAVNDAELTLSNN